VFRVSSSCTVNVDQLGPAHRKPAVVVGAPCTRLGGRGVLLQLVRPSAPRCAQLIGRRGEYNAFIDTRERQIRRVLKSSATAFFDIFEAGSRQPGWPPSHILLLESRCRPSKSGSTTCFVQIYKHLEILAFPGTVLNQQVHSFREKCSFWRKTGRSCGSAVQRANYKWPRISGRSVGDAAWRKRCA
jgi:hypothetical protein